MAQRHLPCRALALTLTALVALAAPTALAQADDAGTTKAALTAERYYSSYGSPADSEDAALGQERYYSSYGSPADGENAALGQERYYSSYGSPPAQTAPTAATADGGVSWTAAILIGAMLTVVAGGLGVLAGRATVRPGRVTA
jgi:hypothetical protein